MTLTLAQTNLVTLTLGLVGGLAIFLLGMNFMTDALKAIAGESMRRLLAKLTGNRFSAAFSGMTITAITQSSSVTTVLLVGFASAGLMTAAQCFGVIIGANIGSTFTAQIIAFNVTRYAPVLLAAGVATQMIARRSDVRQYAGVALGLGLVFAGMAMMSQATHPLREDPAFIDAMHRMTSPAVAIAIGAAFTAIIQSSGAATGLIIILASQGLIDLEGGIALALGANVGTCITAVLASLGKPRAAWRVALMHILFNVIGVLIWCGLIHQLAWMVQQISPAHPELQDLERVAAEAPRQIANAHTVFNVINAALFLAFTGPMVRLINWLLPERGPADVSAVTPKYLDRAVLSTPAIALDQARLELSRAARRVRDMYERLPEAISATDDTPMQAIDALNAQVQSLYDSVVAYLSELSQDDMAAGDSRRLRNLLSIANHAEDLAEIIEQDLLSISRTRLDRKLRPSEGTLEKINALHRAVGECLTQLVEALRLGDAQAARAIVERKDAIYGEVDRLTEHLAQRLGADEPNRSEKFRSESEIKEHLKRCYYVTRRMAKKLADMPTG